MYILYVYIPPTSISPQTELPYSVLDSIYHSTPSPLINAGAEQCICTNAGFAGM